jgi:TATA element modulatory factor
LNYDNLLALGGQELPRELPRASMTANTINDRLQERLARVIAAKNYAVLKNDNHVPSNGPSRAGSPATVGSSPRLSLDQASGDREDPQYLAQSRKEEPQSTIEIDGDSFTNEQAVKDPPIGVLLKNGLEGCPLSIDLNSSGMQKRSTGTSQPISEVEPTEKINGYLVKEPVSAKEVPGLEVQFEQQMSEKLLQEDLENSSAQHQEEIHGYIERIDALQAKLMYVSRESVESARKAAASAPSGSTEKKMAEKDEQIALLMEEGQKLSKAELRHMTVIKKLRARTSEIEKERAEVLRHVENVERENSALSERLKSAEAAEKQANEYQKALTQAQKEIEAQITERDEKNIAIAELKAQLSESVSQSKANEAKLARDLLEQERRRVGELENTLMSLKIEKELAAGRTKARIEELQAMNEREAERARVVDVEMRAEQQALESKLEVLRARAEEASSGVIGDAQAKLLRQIETLQTQYAVARENWQGIEASLASRVTGLEKERDDALKREMDIRRRSREVVSPLYYGK